MKQAVTQCAGLLVSIQTNLRTTSSLVTKTDVLWGQPTWLIQVVSTSEFHEYLWNKVVFIFCPFGFLQDLRSLKI